MIEHKEVETFGLRSSKASMKKGKGTTSGLWGSGVVHKQTNAYLRTPRFQGFEFERQNNFGILGFQGCQDKLQKQIYRQQKEGPIFSTQ